MFTALAMQWSNEGGILYNTSFLSTEKSKDRKQPPSPLANKIGRKDKYEAGAGDQSCNRRKRDFCTG